MAVPALKPKRPDLSNSRYWNQARRWSDWENSEKFNDWYEPEKFRGWSRPTRLSPTRMSDVDRLAKRQFDLSYRRLRPELDRMDTDTYNELTGRGIGLGSTVADDFMSQRGRERSDLLTSLDSAAYDKGMSWADMMYQQQLGKEASQQARDKILSDYNLGYNTIASDVASQKANYDLGHSKMLTDYSLGKAGYNLDFDKTMQDEMRGRQQQRLDMYRNELDNATARRGQDKQFDIAEMRDLTTRRGQDQQLSIAEMNDLLQRYQIDTQDATARRGQDNQMAIAEMEDLLARYGIDTQDATTRLGLENQMTIAEMEDTLARYGIDTETDLTRWLRSQDTIRDNLDRAHEGDWRDQEDRLARDLAYAQDQLARHGIEVEDTRARDLAELNDILARYGIDTEDSRARDIASQTDATTRRGHDIDASTAEGQRELTRYIADLQHALETARLMMDAVSAGGGNVRPPTVTDDTPFTNEDGTLMLDNEGNQITIADLQVDTDEVPIEGTANMGEYLREVIRRRRARFEELGLTPEQIQRANALLNSRGTGEITPFIDQLRYNIRTGEWE